MEVVHYELRQDIFCADDYYGLFKKYLNLAWKIAQGRRPTTETSSAPFSSRPSLLNPQTDLPNATSASPHTCPAYTFEAL